MEKFVEELYRQAERFDEGGIYQSEEYDAIAKKQMELYRKLRLLLGPAGSLLEEYTEALGDECELEGRHFFEQGYQMGRGGTPRE